MSLHVCHPLWQPPHLSVVIGPFDDDWLGLARCLPWSPPEPSLSGQKPPSWNIHVPTWQPEHQPISMLCLLSLLTCTAVHRIHKWREVPPHLMTGLQMLVFFEPFTLFENFEWVQPGSGWFCPLCPWCGHQMSENQLVNLAGMLFPPIGLFRYNPSYRDSSFPISNLDLRDYLWRRWVGLFQSEHAPFFLCPWCTLVQVRTASRVNNIVNFTQLNY
jgi:hypothetical protein